MFAFPLVLVAVLLQPTAQPPTQPPATRPGVFAMPHVRADREKHQLRIAGESLRVDMPLEYICVVAGTSDHEALVRTLARPSDIHAAALVLGLEPGKPVRWSEAKQAFLPPTGPPVRLSLAWPTADGEVVRPIERLLRNVETHQPMPTTPVVFTGSRTSDDGAYIADLTGQIVSVVNFENTVFDVSTLQSDANETLQWETNPDTAPPEGTPCTLVIEPIGDGPTTTQTTKPQVVTTDEVDLLQVHADGSLLLSGRPVTLKDLPDVVAGHHGEVRIAADPQVQVDRLMAVAAVLGKAGVTFTMATDPRIKVDQRRVDELTQRWEKAVLPDADAVREAAQTHYEVIQALRAEQDRLISEADRLQRVIDQLERRYQDLVTPRPMDSDAKSGTNVDAGGDRESSTE